MREFTRILDKNRIEFLDARFYQDQKTGIFVPSVTTINDAYPKSYGFYEYLKKMGDNADEYRDEQGLKGSKVHQLTEDYDAGLECSMVDENGNPRYKQIEWAMFERYVEFRERYKDFKLVANENHYASVKLGFGGTLDRVFEFSIITSGKKSVCNRILIDIKTGNNLYNHFWTQLAAYSKLWNENNPKLQIDNIAILWLNARTKTDGRGNAIQGEGWQLKFSDQPTEYWWRIFQATHQLWLQEYGSLVPKNTIYQLKHKLNG